SLAVLGLLGIAGALTRPTQLSGPLLAALLVLPTVGLAAAPVNSWAAQRAALPPDLRQRRQTEFARERRAVAGRAALVGVGGLLVAVAAAAVLLGAPGPAPTRSPTLLPPAHNGRSQQPQKPPSHSPSPPPTSPSSPATTGTPSSPSSPAPTTSPTTSPSSTTTTSPSSSPSPPSSDQGRTPTPP